MDVFPKFIIETDDELGDCLIIGKCTYHKQMVFNKLKVKGGGWWTKKDNTFILYGQSEDFGPAKLEDIKSIVENKKVYSFGFVRCFSDNFTFLYKISSGEIIKL
jgi:hypothetical protein